MKTTTVTVEGYAIKRPVDFPITLNDFMRLVIGGTIPSARTETNRTLFLRHCLRWHVEGLEAASRRYPELGIPRPRVTAEECLAGFRRAGFFTEEAFDNWARLFLRWRSGLLSRRARTAAERRWQKPFCGARKPVKLNQARRRHASSIRSGRRSRRAALIKHRRPVT